MLAITDGGSLSRVLKLPIDLRLKRLLVERRDQLGGDIENHVRFVIVRPGESLRALESELGFPAFSGDPSFAPDWGQDWGSFYELVWILDDSGYAHVCLIMKGGHMDADLLAVCTTHASEHA